MTMLPYNRAQVAIALSEFFGLKGDLPSQFDGNIIPTINIGDLVDTPYLRYAIPVGRSINTPAVAGQNSYCVARPGPQVALAIDHIEIVNETAASIIVQVAQLTNTNFAATAAIGSAAFCDLAPRDVSANLRSSSVFSRSVAGGLGTTFARLKIPANSSYPFTLRQPMVLYGNDPSGTPALGVYDISAVNETLTCAFFGREWPLPG